MSNTRGRQPVGLNQPPNGGSAYPFISPSEDVQNLLADFFVSFDDLSDAVVYPLRIAWMYGFGDVSVTPPSGWPTPAHTHDIVVLDANNTVVFNSTTAIRFTEEVWDNRLLILEWVTEHNVCRCTVHTDWTEADIADGQSRSYNNYIVPDRGELQPDTWYKLPKRVLSLRVGLTQIKKSSVTLTEGYNVKISQIVDDLTLNNLDLLGEQLNKPLAEGTRVTQKILIESAPAEGLGVFPGCVDEEKVIRTINSVRSDNHQNFIYDSEGCIRTQRPVLLDSSNPRVFKYGSASLPSQAAASSAIKVSNDCTNCCDCEYFARTYQGLKRQWFLFRNTARNAEEVRDNYVKNKERWLAQKQIREANMLRVRMSLDGNCKIRWGMAFCNASKCCISDVTVYLTWLQYLNGVLHTPARPQFDCLPVMLEGDGQCDGPTPIVSDQTNSNGNVAKFKWEYSNPQTVTTLYGRHCIPDCHSYPEGALKFKLHVCISWGAVAKNPSTGAVCVFPEVQYTAIPEEVRNVWSASAMTLPANIKAEKITPLTVPDKSNPFCYRCNCAGAEVII
jgi:hypothetical protein